MKLLPLYHLPFFIKDEVLWTSNIPSWYWKSILSWSTFIIQLNVDISIVNDYVLSSCWQSGAIYQCSTNNWNCPMDSWNCSMNNWICSMNNWHLLQFNNNILKWEHFRGRTWIKSDTYHSLFLYHFSSHMENNYKLYSSSSFIPLLGTRNCNWTGFLHFRSRIV